MKEINNILSQLLDPDKLPSPLYTGTYMAPDYSFSGGDGYIQQDSELVEQLAIAIVSEAKKRIKGYDNHFDHRPVNRQGFIGRLLSDSNHTDLYKLWCRLMCIDNDYKEWGQPYFAINKGKGKNECYNKYYTQELREKKLKNLLDE